MEKHFTVRKAESHGKLSVFRQKRFLLLFVCFRVRLADGADLLAQNKCSVIDGKSFKKLFFALRKSFASDATRSRGLGRHTPRKAEFSKANRRDECLWRNLNYSNVFSHGSERGPGAKHSAVKYAKW